jgi:uncharacterized membrane protein YedE/YeeE
LVATQFTPLASALGGALIGVSAVILMLFYGRIAGITNIFGRLLPPFRNDQLSHATAFIAGLIASTVIYVAATGTTVEQTVSDNLPLLIGAGFLVGFGAIYGGGCTSGHGVCGLSRLSPRSLVATATFMGTALVTVFVVRHLIGA